MVISLYFYNFLLGNFINKSISYFQTSSELAQKYYKRQLEIAEQQHQLFIKKMKKEEQLLEEEHRIKMSILEKQQELANTQLEFWAQKKLLDTWFNM